METPIWVEKGNHAWHLYLVNRIALVVYPDGHHPGWRAAFGGWTLPARYVSLQNAQEAALTYAEDTPKFAFEKLQAIRRVGQGS